MRKTEWERKTQTKKQTSYKCIFQGVCELDQVRTVLTVYYEIEIFAVFLNIIHTIIKLIEFLNYSHSSLAKLLIQFYLFIYVLKSHYHGNRQIVTKLVFKYIKQLNFYNLSRSLFKELKFNFFYYLECFLSDHNFFRNKGNLIIALWLKDIAEWNKIIE